MTRRTALVTGSLGAAGLMAGGVGELALDAAPAVADTLPTSTAPEQLRLEWGADPATEMTVSFSAPGSVPMPAPVLAYSTAPITAANPGALVFLPDPEPLDLSQGPRTGPCATSFTDGPTAQTTYHYHVPLTGLKPDTTYFYEISDGAGSTASAQFQTAPAGRAAFRFTAFGDQSVNQTPVPPFSTAGVADPGDGAGTPLFHLMVGDLAYADGIPLMSPTTWRAWANLVQPATQTFPWMPVMGNHEVEIGATDIHGALIATGASTNGYNGPYGSGNYFSRFLLPDNGLTNWDGNTLQGNFYSFQVGTVLFISLAGNDVNWQTSDYSTSAAGLQGIPKPAQYTGDLAADPSNMALVPDDSAGTPNLQVQWLEDTLQAARAEGSGVEMIVVHFHFPFASVDQGNSCDMGIRCAYGPLFDKYQVDVTLAGHNHNYCRALPTRGFDPPSGVADGAITNPFGSFAEGDTIDTRRPTVTQAEALQIDGEQTWNTSLGTVHLVVGGGGAASTVSERFDPGTGLAVASPFADPSNNVQADEDAPWLGFYYTASAYGYGVFDVDPGDGPGQTSITFQWFQLPSTGAPLPTEPLEKMVFARLAGQITPGAPEIDGTVAVGRTVTAKPGSWSPASVSLGYQWLLDGAPIDGATSGTYTIAAGDFGHDLQVEVTGTLEGFTTTSAKSAATVVAGGLLAPSAVTVSGAFAVGGTVTADATPWTPPATLTYQWLLDGQPIAGATGTSYSPVAGDAGHVLEVKVTGTAPGYQTASVTSVPQTVGPRPTAPLRVPALSATPRVGVKVHVVLAAGAVTDGLSYQWLLDGRPIRRATAPTYTPAPADAGKRLQIRLEQAGQTVVSRPETVRAAEFRAASRPGLRGRAAVGSTLTAVTGHWLPHPAFDYQWLADGKAIKRATHQKLKLTAVLAGKHISLRITAKRTGYVSRETTSGAVIVRQGTLDASVPRIGGSPRVGGTLHVLKGHWSPEAEFSYQWLVGGRPVAHRGTGIAYKVGPQDLGKRITVEVTARAAGYEPVVRTSRPARFVRGA